MRTGQRRRRQLGQWFRTAPAVSFLAASAAAASASPPAAPLSTAPPPVPPPAAMTPSTPAPTFSAAPAGPLTPEASVRFALAHNPQLQAAAAQRSLALAKLIPDRPTLRPNVTASASQSIEGPRKTIPLVGGPGVVFPGQEHRLWVEAQQMLYHAGRSQNDVRLAAETASADAAYADAAAATAHDTLVAYYQVLQARAGEAVAQQAVVQVGQSVETVRLLMQAGQAVQLDLLNAQSALAQVQQQVVAASSGLSVAEANFNRTLGRPLRTPVDLADAGEPPLPAGTLDAAVATALASRPDLRQRQAELQSARAALALARTEGGPTVNADASYALQTPTALQPDPEWTLRATVSLPVFETAQQRSDVAQAQAGVQAAEAGLAAQRDGDALLVWKAWQDLETARSLVDADASDVAVQTESLRGVGLKEQVHEATEGDAAQARLKLEQAVSKETRDRYDSYMRVLDLDFAMGLLAPPVGASSTGAAPPAFTLPGSTSPTPTLTTPPSAGAQPGTPAVPPPVNPAPSVPAANGPSPAGQSPAGPASASSSSGSPSAGGQP